MSHHKVKLTPVLLAVFMFATFALSATLRPRETSADTNPGTTVFSAVGRYKVVLGWGSETRNMNIQLDSGATVAFAVMGYIARTRTAALTTLDIGFGSSLGSDLTVPGGFDGTVIGNLAPTTRTFPTGFATGDAYQQYADITSLLQTYGSGDYQISNLLTENISPVFSHSRQFIIAVMQDPSYPLDSIAINDFFTFLDGPGTENTSLSADLPAVPGADQYVQMTPSALVIFGTPGGSDMSASANFVAGSSSGALDGLVNINDEPSLSGFWPRWNPATTSFQTDLTATQLNIDVQTELADGAGLSYVASWLIVVTPLVTPGGVTPEMPIVYPQNPGVITPTVPPAPGTPNTGFWTGR
jgi:hypothetical protein